MNKTEREIIKNLNREIQVLQSEMNKSDPCSTHYQDCLSNMNELAKVKNELTRNKTHISKEAILTVSAAVAVELLHLKMERDGYLIKKNWFRDILSTKERF